MRISKSNRHTAFITIRVVIESRSETNSLLSLVIIFDIDPFNVSTFVESAERSLVNALIVSSSSLGTGGVAVAHPSPINKRASSIGIVGVSPGLKGPCLTLSQPVKLKFLGTLSVNHMVV